MAWQCMASLGAAQQSFFEGLKMKQIAVPGLTLPGLAMLCEAVQGTAQ